jgi:hypothetical protein
VSGVYVDEGVVWSFSIEVEVSRQSQGSLIDLKAIARISFFLNCARQGCQVFLGITYQNRKNIPNGPKIHFFVANQVQIISWSSELNGCGFLLLCQEQNTTSRPQNTCIKCQKYTKWSKICTPNDQKYKKWP